MVGNLGKVIVSQEGGSQQSLMHVAQETVFECNNMEDVDNSVPHVLMEC